MELILNSSMFVRPFVLTLLLLLPVALLGCAGKEPPVLSAPVGEVEPILERLAVVPLEFSTKRTLVFDLEIREKVERAPGELQTLAATSRCDASKLASLADQRDMYPESISAEDVDQTRRAFLRCLSNEGATSVLIPRLRNVSAPFNMGMAFFCGGSLSIRRVEKNPFATSDNSRTRGSVGAFCLEVSLYRLNGERVYIREAPFAPTSHLDSKKISGFVPIRLETSLASLTLRSRAIEAAITPLVDALTQPNE